MNIYIIEGIATSGKSTITQGLVKALSDKRVTLVTESETHESIMDRKNEVHVSFFMNLVTSKMNENPDLLIFDRLYLTQAFRAQTDLDAYGVVEQKLLKHKVMTIFLKVKEGTIATRVAKATEHRNPEWTKYVSTKGSSSDEIAEYYIQQQKSQLTLLKSSHIPYKICDTSDHEYDEIIRELAHLD